MKLSEMYIKLASKEEAKTFYHCFAASAYCRLAKWRKKSHNYLW
jgi:hypothetical protein